MSTGKLWALSALALCVCVAGYGAKYEVSRQSFGSLCCYGYTFKMPMPKTD